MTKKEIKRMEEFVSSTLQPEPLYEYRLGYEEGIRRCYYVVDNCQQRIEEATKWVKKHIYKYKCKSITIIDWDELSNPNDLLDILEGVKENE